MALSLKRASKPFERIHLDIKLYPVNSYHKYRFAVLYFDNCTLHAWVVNLRTKSGALSATHQWLAMVENKYHAKVKQWMSDGGGEYKSKAFDDMLKDKGIEILQSVPN